MRYYAHTATNPGEEWQPLAEHLRAVAEQAGEFGKPLGMEEHAAWCGLHHDLGKYTERFQGRLRNPAADSENE